MFVVKNFIVVSVVVYIYIYLLNTKLFVQQFLPFPQPSNIMCIKHPFFYKFLFLLEFLSLCKFFTLSARVCLFISLFLLLFLETYSFILLYLCCEKYTCEVKIVFILSFFGDFFYYYLICLKYVVIVLVIKFKQKFCFINKSKCCMRNKWFIEFQIFWVFYMKH